MDELLAELEKTNADLAKKMRASHASALDEQKGLVTAEAKKTKAAEAALAKLKADTDASGKTVEEATAQARKERDEAKAEAKKIADERHADRVKLAIERKLGITDETKARRAVSAFLEHAKDVDIDEHGKLVGADKAVESFKAAEAFWFDAPTTDPAKPTTPRAGSGPSAAKPAGSSNTKTAPSRADKIAAHKANMAPGAKKKGE